MRLTALLTTAILLAFPGVAAAQCYGSEEASMSCAEGTTWDATSQTCVATATS